MVQWLRRQSGRFIRWSLTDEFPKVKRDDRSYTERTWRFTRILALLGFALSVLSLIVTGLFVITIWTVNNDFVAENPQFKFDENFDAIASAAAIGRLDIVAVLLTFLGIVAAFSVLYGWTAFRSKAIEAAKAETEARVPEELRRLMDSDGDRLIGIALQDAELLAKIQRGFTDVGIDDTEEAFLVDDNASWTDEGESDEQGNGASPPVSPGDSGERGSVGRKPWYKRILRL